MEFFVVLLFFMAVIAIFNISNLSNKQDLQKYNIAKYPYFKNTALLTPAEISFRHSLRIAVEDRFEINSKVRLADIISVHKGLPKSVWSSSFNQIKAKHLDFVLVDKETTEIICGIELDDSSHNKPDRQQRDGFLDAALESANLPLLRFAANHAYKSREIADSIDSVLSSISESGSSNQDNDEQVKVRIAPVFDLNELNESSGLKCPQCGSDLVEREASKGRHVGVKFLGCSNFPKCRYRKVVGESN